MGILDKLLTEFYCDPDTGFIYNEGCKISLSLNNSGYRTVWIANIKIGQHVAMWAYHNHAFPVHEIDHKNRIKTDNRLANLREVTRSINAHNTKLFSTNTSGYKGVAFHKASKSWRASIRLENKDHYLGYFSTPEDAYSARLKAEVELGINAV